MMNKRNLVYVPYLLLLFICISCSAKKEEKDFNSDEITVKENKWRRNKFVKKHSTLLKNTEESHFIGVEKIKIKEDNIYVLDKYSQHKLFVFSGDGEFVNVVLLNQVDEKSEEKNKIWDFDVNNKGEVVLFDQNRKEMFFYAVDGALIKSVKLPYDIDAFACLESGGHILSVKKNGGLEENSKVVITDADFNVVKSYFSYTQNAMDNKVSKYLFRDSPQGLVYNKAADEFLVVFDKVNGDVVKTYSVNFGDKEMPQDLKDDFMAYANSYEDKAAYFCMYETPFLVSDMLIGNLYVQLKKGIFAHDIAKGTSYLKSFSRSSLSLVDLNFPLYVSNESTIVSFLDLRTYNLMKDRHLLDSVSRAHVKKGGVLLNFFEVKKETGLNE